MPMFQSQTAIAWNPALVKAPPKSYDELAAWAKENPRKFGYNGIKGGMSGVAFVVGWVYANTPDAEQLMNGPYDAATKAKWDGALGKLKEFNRSVVITPGNAGTLDMLNRGEIAHGTGVGRHVLHLEADGKLPPEHAPAADRPGHARPADVLRDPGEGGQHGSGARSSSRWRPAREVQAEGIVKKFNWYPGIDAQHVKAQLDDKTWNKLFVDVTPRGAGGQGQDLPDQAVLRRHPRELREEGPELSAHARSAAGSAPLLVAPALLMVLALFVYPARLLARHRVRGEGRRLHASAISPRRSSSTASTSASRW